MHRLDRLERENRCLKWVGSAVLIGLAILALMGQATPARVQKVVEAERFVLRDTYGKLRATLTVEGGSAGLKLFDETGTARAALALLNGWPALSLQDQAGKPRAMLGVSPGESGLIFFDAAGKSRAVLTVAGNSPRLTLSDQAGKVIWRAP